MKRWLLLALLPGTAFAYSYAWEWTGAVDHFEMKLDGVAYVSVGLPPVASGTWTLPGDPTLTGTHSAVVRACTGTTCTPDSNVLSFTVAPAPVPASPVNLRLVTVQVESPSGTIVTTAGPAIIDSTLASWSFTTPVGAELAITRNGVINGQGIKLCYASKLISAFSNGVWYHWNNGWNSAGTTPAVCL